MVQNSIFSEHSVRLLSDGFICVASF